MIRDVAKHVIVVFKFAFRESNDDPCREKFHSYGLFANNKQKKPLSKVDFFQKRGE